MVQVINTIDQPQFDRHEAEAVNSAEKRSLYASRVKIHPKAVSGTFRRLKWAILAVALAIYYLAPWLRWTRPGDAPDQAILIDLASRRFYFFFIEIWPQEFYYVAGLLIMAGVGLFLVTSLFGRAWCGYACPQTVWTDLFMKVEAWAEGDRNARIKLDAAPLSFGKVRKRAVKLVLWFLIAVATGGFWVFYFADAPTLLGELVTFQAQPVAYFTIAILTATTFTFAGFMREQVCTYMCPWPRIQGAMLDEHSLVVTYNAWRGEPRSGHRKKAEVQGLKVGDCVDCNACVAVCPMGIDIRDGNQLECINCALCIDACDAVMAKVGLPKGLISYSTTSLYAANVAGKAVQLVVAFAAAGSHGDLFRRLGRRWPHHAGDAGGARPARRQHCGRPQSAVRQTIGRLHPQWLYHQNSQHEAGAAQLPHHHCGPSRSCHGNGWRGEWRGQRRQHRCGGRGRQAARRQSLCGNR